MAMQKPWENYDSAVDLKGFPQCSQTKPHHSAETTGFSRGEEISTGVTKAGRLGIKGGLGKNGGSVCNPIPLSFNTAHMGTQNEQIQYEAMVSKGVSMRICYWGEDSKWSSGVVSVVLTAPKFGVQIGDLYTFLR